MLVAFASRSRKKINYSYVCSTCWNQYFRSTGISTNQYGISRTATQCFSTSISRLGRSKKRASGATFTTPEASSRQEVVDGEGEEGSTGKGKAEGSSDEVSNVQDGSAGKANKPKGRRNYLSWGASLRKLAADLLHGEHKEGENDGAKGKLPSGGDGIPKTKDKMELPRVTREVIRPLESKEAGTESNAPVSNSIKGSKEKSKSKSAKLLDSSAKKSGEADKGDTPSKGGKNSLNKMKRSNLIQLIQSGRLPKKQQAVAMARLREILVRRLNSKGEAIHELEEEVVEGLKEGMMNKGSKEIEEGKKGKDTKDQEHKTSKGKDANGSKFTESREIKSNDAKDNKSSKPAKKSKSKTQTSITKEGGESLEAATKYDTIRDVLLDRPKKGKSIKTKTTNTGPINKKKGMEGYDIQSLEAESLNLVPVEKPQRPVPSLAYGLERVLFNPGVYHLQDPRSGIFNFDPYLQTIMPVNEFDFNALKDYITSSKDNTLLDTAVEQEKKYSGSTSSMTSALAQFHFLLSQWRTINPGKLSKNFPVDFDTFTALQRAPSAIFLKWKDGRYAIDADKEFDKANILSLLGKSMEKFMTLPSEEYEKYRRINSHQISEEQCNESESYHYTTMGDFLMRSQLDANDPRLPGTGMFDLKTRAVVSIRMDVSDYEQGLGYEIQGRHGEYESFEREYYDMIRAAFLKYSLQVRMGRMDGIFVAFHNIERIFGFQYISLSEMDYALHGSEDTTIGDSEFKLSLELLNRALDRATAKFPEKTLRLHFETRPTETPFMYIFAEPMEEEQVKKIQEKNKAKISEFEREVMGLDRQESEEEVTANLEEKEKEKEAEWARVRARVEESVENDELDVSEARAIVQELIEDNEILGLAEEDVAREVELLLEAIYSDGVGVEEGKKNEEDQSEEGIVEGEEGRVVEEQDGDEELGEGRVVHGDANETDDEESEEGRVVDSDAERNEFEELAEEIENGGRDEVAMETDIEKSEDIEEPEKDISSEEAADSINETKDEQSEDIDTTTSTPKSSITPSDTTSTASLPPPSPNPSSDLLTMVLTIRNKVNNSYVTRPRHLTSADKWTVEYALAEFTDPERARNLYKACKLRREKALTKNKQEEVRNPRNGEYIENLRALARKGREWRRLVDGRDREGGLKVLGGKEGERKG